MSQEEHHAEPGAGREALTNARPVLHPRSPRRLQFAHLGTAEPAQSATGSHQRLASPRVRGRDLQSRCRRNAPASGPQCRPPSFRAEQTGYVPDLAVASTRQVPLEITTAAFCAPAVDRRRSRSASSTPASPGLGHAPSLGIIRSALLLVSFQPLMDLECRVHVELPVHALLPWPEVGGRLRHRDYLRPLDLVGVLIGHNGRRAFIKDVLQPVGALTIGEGDQEAVTMPGRDDRCLVSPARSPPDMADDRRAGSFLTG